MRSTSPASSYRSSSRRRWLPPSRPTRAVAHRLHHRHARDGRAVPRRGRRDPRSGHWNFISAATCGRSARRSSRHDERALREPLEHQGPAGLQSEHALLGLSSRPTSTRRRPRQGRAVDAVATRASTTRSSSTSDLLAEKNITHVIFPDWYDIAERVCVSDGLAAHHRAASRRSCACSCASSCDASACVAPPKAAATEPRGPRPEHKFAASPHDTEPPWGADDSNGGAAVPATLRSASTRSTTAYYQGPRTRRRARPEGQPDARGAREEEEDAPNHRS